MNCKETFNAEIQRTGNINKAFKNLSKECKEQVYYFPELKPKQRYNRYVKIVRELTEKKSGVLFNIEKRQFRLYDIDHIVPISLAYKLNILPYLIASSDNLQVISNIDNFAKGNNITAKGQMLLNEWGIKY